MMLVQCSVCGCGNPPHAKYCCMCGQPVYRAPSRPIRRIHRDLAWVLVGAGMLLSTCLAVGAVQLARHDRISRRAGPTIERAFSLSHPKADALYELLRPSDVRVIVGRKDGGVYVRGTAKEVETLSRFVQLLTREPCLSVLGCDERMNALRPTWTSVRHYRLSRSKAGALFQLLAFDDVPVLVSRNRSKITVQAAPDDQTVIRAIVTILRGKRLSSH